MRANGKGCDALVRPESLRDLETPGMRLSALTGRVHRMARSAREAKAVGRELADLGALMEPPESLDALKTAMLDDPAFAEFAMAMGLNDPYRPATPDEIKDLEDFPLAMWPLRLHEGGLN
jgi:hypothetical protein